MGRLTTVGIAALSAALVTGVLSSAEDAPASAETKRAPGPVIVPGSFTGYPLLNGAAARVVVDDSRHEIAQTWEPGS
jgi:hypothetical protein